MPVKLVLNISVRIGQARCLVKGVQSVLKRLKDKQPFWIVVHRLSMYSSLLYSILSPEAIVEDPQDIAHIYGSLHCNHFSLHSKVTDCETTTTNIVLVSQAVALLEMMNWLQWRIPYMQAMSYTTYTIAFLKIHLYKHKRCQLLIKTGDLTVHKEAVLKYHYQTSHYGSPEGGYVKVIAIFFIFFTILFHDVSKTTYWYVFKHTQLRFIIAKI